MALHPKAERTLAAWHRGLQALGAAMARRMGPILAAEQNRRSRSEEPR